MSQDPNKLFAGIKVRNHPHIIRTLSCELCHLLLLHPTQLLCCGTRLCRWCSTRGVPNRKPFVCPFCRTQQSTKQACADRGAERELNIVTTECYACSWTGSYKDYLMHLQQQHADLECDQCHDRFFTLNSIEEHREEMCAYRRVSCELPGCAAVVTWSEMQRHYVSDGHQRLLLEFIIQYFHSRSKSRDDMDRVLTAIQESVVAFSPTLTTLFSKCVRLRSKHNELKATSERTILQANEAVKISNENVEKLNKHVQAQDETVKVLDDTKKSCVSTKILLLNDDAIVIFPFDKHHNDFKSSFSIYSSPFKTASFGYSLILRLSSTTDLTNNNQSYLSIFISLLRGDFDPILVFPFPYNISLCLYDQSGQGKHITSTITPDPQSLSCARPTRERNDEMGVVQFCPLHYLKDGESIYVRASMFYIGVFIDFMNTGSTPFG